jgi:hypothetical protein
MREVALMPGSNDWIFKLPAWLPIVQNQSSHELWVDYWQYEVQHDARREDYTKKHSNATLKLTQFKNWFFMIYFIMNQSLNLNVLN